MTRERTDRIDQRRAELARTLERDRLYSLDYQDGDVLRDAFAEGYTIEEIAFAFDVSTQTIERWMRKRDVQSPRATTYDGTDTGEGTP